jgi:hypothetical protein
LKKLIKDFENEEPSGTGNLTSEDEAEKIASKRCTHEYKGLQFCRHVDYGGLNCVFGVMTRQSRGGLDGDIEAMRTALL